MIKKRISLFLSIVLSVVIHSLSAQSISFYKYHSPAEVQEILKTLQKNHPNKARLHTLASSPGGEPVTVIEIGSKLENVPALFVGANFEGNVPPTTEGALRLAQMLFDSAEYTTNKKWYILPLPNPDAAKGFFAEIKYNRSVNDFDINNDVDEASGEDGYDDLNGDGFITKMRVKDLEGQYIASKEDPRIMVKADVQKGERGEFKIYSEGLDNDNDGKYNEDGEGGINTGIAFPHLFPIWNKKAGLWPGQTPEVYGILRFIYDRPEISMVYTLGSSNFCLQPPKNNRKGDANLDKLKFPSRYAKIFNVDENQTFTMDEVIEIMKQKVPAAMDVTPAMVAGMFDLGVAVNPMKEDLDFYKHFSEEYKKYLKNNNFSLNNLAPEPAKDGSFELWAYYHLGLPSFSMRLFSVADIGKEKEGEQSQEKQKKTSEEKDDELSNKDKALLAWSEKEWDGKGFVEWQEYEHPGLGKVEIGGYVPYLETTPKPEHLDSLLNIQLPWLLRLSGSMPEIVLAEEKITALGSGVYKLELYLENRGFLPYPIAMGQRNNQPAPVVIVLDGEIELLEGIRRQPLGNLGGNQVKKLEWLLKAGKNTPVSVTVESAMFGNKVKQIKIGS